MEQRSLKEEVIETFQSGNSSPNGEIETKVITSNEKDVSMIDSTDEKIMEEKTSWDEKVVSKTTLANEAIMPDNTSIDEKVAFGSTPTDDEKVASNMKIPWLYVAYHIQIIT